MKTPEEELLLPKGDDVMQEPAFTPASAHISQR